MKRFLASVLSTAALTFIMPIAAHAAPQGSSSVFLSKLGNLFLGRGLSDEYELVQKNPDIMVDFGQKYCSQKASGMSEDAINELWAKGIVDSADESNFKLFTSLIAGVHVNAEYYLCPEVRQQNPSDSAIPATYY